MEPHEWEDVKRRLSSIEELARVRVSMSNAAFADLRKLEERVSEMERALEDVAHEMRNSFSSARENVAGLREKLFAQLGSFEMALKRGERSHEANAKLIADSVA
jgi:hypothetical protein